MKPSTFAYTIREATEEDFSDIISLLKEFSMFQKTPERMKMTAAQLEKDKGFFHFLLAVADNHQVAGYVCFFPAYYSWSGKAFYIDDLFVKEEYRGVGMGKQLLEAVVQKATEEGCKKVRWQVSKWNEDAIQFYQSIGGEVEETELNCTLLL